jgi:NADP-dependent 3-hydroxy acid dehydrogenase YdfG
VAAELPGVAHYIVTDLSAEHAAEEVAVRLQPRRGIDVLVISSGAYARSQDRAGFEDLLAANLLGPYALVRRLLPSLVGAQGQVVFINSTQALKATAEVGQYAATKHAMKAIADSLRDEVNLEGVRVASMFLGRTATGMQEAIFAAEGREYTPERLVQPEDVARIVLSVLRLPRTAEVTDLVIRPMRNPQQLSHRGRIG